MILRRMPIEHGLVSERELSFDSKANAEGNLGELVRDESLRKRERACYVQLHAVHVLFIRT